MTKNEFLKIVENELKKLKIEYRDVWKKVRYYETIAGMQSIQYKKSCFHLSLLSKKIKSLTNFLKFPIFARIQSMSEIEIEKYRHDKIESLQNKIQLLKNIEKDLTDELLKLQEMEEKNIEIFNNIMPGNSLENVIKSGKDIIVKIADVKKKIKGIQEEIEKALLQMEQMKTKSVEDIKNDFLSHMNDKELKDNENLYNAISNMKVRLLSSVADDYDKSCKMVNLLEKYNQLISKRNIAENIVLEPCDLLEIIEKRQLYSRFKKELSKPDEILEIIDEYERDFYKKKSKIKSIDNLDFKDINFLRDKDKIDISYLEEKYRQIFSNYSNDDFIKLKELISRKRSLEQRLIKTRYSTLKIEKLDSQIKYIKSQICQKIIEYYHKAFSSLGDDICYSFKKIINFYEKISDEEALAEFEKLKSLINGEHIKRIREKVENSKKQMGKNTAILESQIKEVIESMISLSEYDIDVKDFNIGKVANDKDGNIEQIINSGTIDTTLKLSAIVKEEAQRQANIQEAKIRGISLEELLKEKEIIQYSQEDNEEEITHISK